MLAGCRNNSRSTQPGPSPSPAPATKLGDASPINFEDRAAASGVTYIYPNQPKPMRILEAFGCGCAFLDYDDDGWMDIILVARPHPILYHNRGNGTFEDVTNSSGIDKLTCDWWTGVAVGDFDGDGRVDLVMT